MFNSYCFKLFKKVFYSYYLKKENKMCSVPYFTISLVKVNRKCMCGHISVTPM